jgi:hypothetical protein
MFSFTLMVPTPHRIFFFFYDFLPHPPLPLLPYPFQQVPLGLTLGVMGAIFYFMRGRMGGGGGGMDGLMNIGKSGVTKINKGGT